MRNRSVVLNRRPATVAPIAAFMMATLVGMLAFSIDIGYICSVQAELQDAADAAALAGAQQLEQLFVNYYAAGQTNQQSILSQATTDTTLSSSPIPTAQQYAYYNQAGGVYVTVPASDVSFSYYNGTIFSSASATNFPNTCTVKTRRDNVANGTLGLFFGKVFGITNLSLNATASATIYNGNMSSWTNTPPFTTSGTLSKITIDSSALPVALDMNTWEAFTNANWTSPYLSGVVSTNSNGRPQLQVYPNTTNTPGNFGLVDLGPPATNVPAFRSWIDSGVTPNDISYLLSKSMLPVSPSAPANWTVGPGLKSTLVTNFQSVMGLQNLIPLFQPYQAYDSTKTPAYIAAASQGSGATYSVVGFVGVTVSQAEYSGSNMVIAIQPMGIVDPTGVISNPLPAATITQQSGFSGYVSGSQTSFGPIYTTFVPAKLTQ